MVDRESLIECLNTVNISQSSKTARETIETLLRIHRNILDNQEEVHYRKIKVRNPVFLRKVWCLYPARQFLLLSGWIEINEEIIFNSDERLIDIIEVLVDHRVVAPLVEEWQEETKHEGKSENQLRDEFLRRKAIEEREKELKEYNEDKRYRENLANSIKKQIESDKAQRRQVFTHPVVGNKLVKGAKIKTLNSTPTSNQGNPRM